MIGPFITDGIVPNVFSLTNTSSKSVLLTSISSIATNSIATLYLNVTISGISKNEYILTQNIQSINVISITNQPINSPKIITVIFSNDGSSLYVSFDYATDKGSIDISLFKCNLLFDFIGNSNATCQWQDHSNLIIMLGNQATVSINDIFTLKPGVIKSYCDDTYINCKLWRYSPQMNILIQKPINNNLKPIIVINSVSYLSVCTPLTIDFSSSSGSGGRDWYNSSVKVIGPNGRDTNIENQLKTSIIFTNSIIIGSSNFILGNYYIEIILCNYLLNCGINSKIINIINNNIPNIYIIGNNLRQMYSYSEITLQAVSTIADCSLGTSNDLLYVWSIYQNNIQNLTIKSFSKQNYMFKLQSYILQSNNTYEFVVTVLDQSNNQASKTSVTINILSSNIIPIISNGIITTMKIKDYYIIDGSTSYDLNYQNKPNLIGKPNNNFIFQWNCYQILPILNNSCIFSMNSLNNNSQLMIFTNDSSHIGSSSIIELTILSDFRMETTKITINIVSKIGIIVSLNTITSLIINPNLEIKLIANITTNYHTNCLWKVNDSSIDLTTNILLTNYSNYITNNNNKIQNLYFILSENILSVHSTYMFQIICSTIATTTMFSTTSVASIVIQTNEPPKAGLFVMNPMIGYELQTIYQSIATQWIDYDLPITYEFGYLEPTNSLFMYLTDKNELSYTFNQLISGFNNTLNCFVIIYDNFNANTTVYSLITVIKTQQINDINSIQSFLSQNLLISNNFIDIKQTITLTSSLLNQISCLNAPNCAQINRYSCQQVTNTCGYCMNGFIGEIGNYNSYCISEITTINSLVSYDLNLNDSNQESSQRNSQQLKSQFSSQQSSQLMSDLSTGQLSSQQSFITINSQQTCIESIDCNNNWKFCNINNICEFKQKNCINNCTLNGKCIFQEFSTGKSVETCYINDPSCTAVCMCNKLYSGFQCLLTNNNILLKQIINNQLLLNLYNITFIEDLNILNLYNNIQLLLTLTQNSDELNENSLQIITKLIKIYINYSIKLNINNNKKILFIQIINSIINSINYYNFNNNIIINDLLLSINNQTKLCELIIHSLVTDLLPGQTDITTVYPFIRLTIQSNSFDYYSINNNNNNNYINTKAMLPLTDYEIYNNILQTNINLNIQLNNQFIQSNIQTNKQNIQNYVSFGLFTIHSQSFINQINNQFNDYSVNYTSNPFIIILSENTNTICIQNNCQTNINNIQTLETIKYENITSKQYFAIKCEFGIKKSIYYNCNNEFSIIIECNGTFSGLITKTCPFRLIEPICLSIHSNNYNNILINNNNNNINNNNNCNQTFYNKDFINCDCFIQLNNNNHNLYESLIITTKTIETIIQSIETFTSYLSPTLQPTSTSIIKTIKINESNIFITKYYYIIIIIFFILLIIFIIILFYYIKYQKIKNLQLKYGMKFNENNKYKYKNESESENESENENENDNSIHSNHSNKSNNSNISNELNNEIKIYNNLLIKYIIYCKKINKKYKISIKINNLLKNKSYNLLTINEKLYLNNYFEKIKIELSNDSIQTQILNEAKPIVYRRNSGLSPNRMSQRLELSKDSNELNEMNNNNINDTIKFVSIDKLNENFVINSIETQKQLKQSKQTQQKLSKELESDDFPMTIYDTMNDSNEITMKSNDKPSFYRRASGLMNSITMKQSNITSNDSNIQTNENISSIYEKTNEKNEIKQYNSPMIRRNTQNYQKNLEKMKSKRMNDKTDMNLNINSDNMESNDSINNNNNNEKESVNESENEESKQSIHLSSIKMEDMYASL